MKTPPTDKKTPSSLLKELCDRSGKSADFEYFDETKQGETQRFVCEVQWGERIVGRGMGQSKKVAKQEACLEAIETLAGEEDYREILSKLYHNTPPELHPVQSLQLLSQRQHASHRFETSTLCRLYWNEKLLSTSEAPCQSEARRTAALSGLSILTSHPSSPPHLTDKTPYEVYLRALSLDLIPTSLQINECRDLVSTILEWKKVLFGRNVVDVWVLGSVGIGAMRRNKEVIDVGLVAEGDIDLHLCVNTILNHHSDRKYAFTLDNSSENDQKSVTLTAGSCKITLFHLFPSSYLTHYRTWIRGVTINAEQIAAIRLLKHWKEGKSEKRKVPGEVLEWKVSEVMSAGMTPGEGFRRVVQWVASGGTLPGSESGLPVWVTEALDRYTLEERVSATGEGFVAVVQLAKNCVSTLF